MSLTDSERRVWESQGAACFKKTRPKPACYITSTGSSQLVWIFIYCRQQCKEISWLLRISMLIIWPEISHYFPGIGSGSPVPPSLGTGLSPSNLLHPLSNCSMPSPQPCFKLHLCSALKSQLNSPSTYVYLYQVLYYNKYDPVLALKRKKENYRVQIYLCSSLATCMILSKSF